RKPEALVVERRQLEPLKAQAAYTIDTTDLSAQQLRNRILGLFGEAGSREIVSVTLLSFGYKYGIPADADFVFDSRMLPNPFYDAGLRDLTGNDEPVSEFVLGLPAAGELLELIHGTLQLALVHYPSVHKFSAVVAVGCTGGKHRSVSLVNRLGQLLSADGAKCVVQHRDIERV
ncbi:MAG TPA: RNase adaptor protein RapZ, partial [Firmicutes bacterium]|nr:RNase adaptor protein RapZ [Bacillota bacterium]